MKRIVAATITAGVLAGAAGAAVQAKDAAPTAPQTKPAQAAPIPVSARPPGRLPDGRFAAGYVHYRVHHTRVPVRIPDPAGGPDWALKSFDAERVTLDRPARTLAGAKAIGHSRCVQLGRMQDGAFGWVYADGRFRRVPAGNEFALVQCTGFKRPRLSAELKTTLDLADPAEPKLSRAVVWGIAPKATAVTVAGTGGADGAAQLAGGVFLELGDPAAKADDDARVEAGGHRLRLGPTGPHFPPSFKIKFPTPIPGSERIEARAPDPAGGPGWGLPVAQTREGVPCVTQPAQVAGDRAGSIDLRLALMTGGGVVSASACRPLQTKPDPKRACDVGWGGGSAEELEGGDAFARRARTERRLLSGRTQVWGQCSDQVDRITVRTPRDVRTLAPSAVGHAFLAVYDGDFPAGKLQITAHLKNGKTWTESHELGF
jgi:hypothetical protein